MTERPVVADDHRASIRHFLDALRRRAHALRTVVHVGAHHGEEVDEYRRHGAERIVLVEANPDAAAHLDARFGADADITVVHAAATEAPGPVRLQRHVNRRGEAESASLLAMKRLGEIVPTLSTRDEVTVPGTPLDALLDDAGVAPEDLGLLTIDVQGGELMVLRGGPRALRSAAAVLCEVQLIDLYDGAPREEDIDALLTACGLAPVDALYYELYEGDRRFPAWGDRLYVRATPEATAPRGRAAT